MNLIDKAMVGLERIDSNFGRSSTVGKMPSNITAGYREIVPERRGQSMRQLSSLSYFKKLPQPPPIFSYHHLDQSAVINI